MTRKDAVQDGPPIRYLIQSGIYNLFVWRPRGMVRLWKARRAGRTRQRQAMTLWLDHGTDEAARLLDVSPLEVAYLVLAASEQVTDG